jgi:polyphenol oxidase
MFYQDSRGLFRSTLLDIASVEHGFGTRHELPGWPPELSAQLHQIHSDRIVTARVKTGRIGEGDALITAVSGLWIAVRTADCLPILIVDPVTRCVAAVHAGWRGSAGQIVAKAVGELARTFGSNPANLFAAIGPGIGHCCYEVSAEVARQFAAWIPELADAEGKVMLNLTEVNRRQLLQAGVPEGSIDCSGECTFCRADEFYSFRRVPGEAGRMVSGICIR